MALVKKGARYFFNPTQNAVYPYSADLEKIKGLIPFTASTTGEFNIGMTLAGAASGEAVKPKAQVAKPLTQAQIAAAAKRKNALTEKQQADAAEAQAAADLASAEQDAENADADAAGTSAKSTPKPIKVPPSTLNPVDFQGE
jgi:phage-related minor tail protein